MIEEFPFQKAHDAIVSMLHDYLAEKEHAERLEAENARLKAEVERLSAELSNITGWGRGLESDLSWARAELLMVKAEVERLTAENASVKLGNAELRQMVIERGETAVEDIRVICRLEVEVERLTKAGDAMLLALNKRDDVFDNSDKDKAISDWNAAKEGKQS
jgi:regulator of replication initiation timing